jgi:hypothetical protein
MAIDTITILDGNGVARKVLVDNDGSNNYTQVEKIGFSAEDSAPVLVSSSNPLPVDGAVGGTWGYKAGTSGTPTLTSKRVVSISCLAGGSGATITINGGDTITVPADTPFGIPINGRLTAPTIVFTGTTSYFVETSA